MTWHHGMISWLAIMTRHHDMTSRQDIMTWHYDKTSWHDMTLQDTLTSCSMGHSRTQGLPPHSPGPCSRSRWWAGGSHGIWTWSCNIVRSKSLSPYLKHSGCSMRSPINVISAVSCWKGWPQWLHFWEACTAHIAHNIVIMTQSSALGLKPAQGQCHHGSCCR